MNEPLKVSMFKNIAIGNRWIWQSFNLDFISNSKNEELKKFLNDKVCNIQSKEISARLKNYWIEHGLIEDKRPNNSGWHKFSISEYIWIKLILRLKKFNLSNAQIKNIRECLKFSSNQCSISDMPYLDFFIAQSLMGNIIQLAITSEGEAYFLTTYQLSTIKHLNNFSDYISIDLNSIVRDIFINITPNYLKIVELSEMEEIAIKSIREKVGVKSLQIKIKENEIIDLEREITVDINKRSEVLSKINFGHIKTEKYNGKIVKSAIVEKFKPTKNK